MSTRLDTWAENIRSARTRAGLTQAELAKRIDVRQSAVGRWETGAAGPREPHKMALAKVLDADPVDLFPFIEDDE